MEGTVEHKMKGNHPSQVWFNFARWFQRRGFKTKVYNGQQIPSDEKSSLGLVS
jgi:hypothetical protein